MGSGRPRAKSLKIMLGAMSGLPIVLAPVNDRLGLDQFFSCRFDEISQEVSSVGATAAYGVFTRCSTNALKGMEPEAIELDSRIEESGDLGKARGLS